MYQCRDKLVLCFGLEAEPFFKAYATSDADAPRGAFVDLKGRVVAMFDRANLPSGETLIVVERNVEEKLLKHLKPYLFLMEVRVQAQDRNVYFDPTSIYHARPDEIVIPQKKGNMILTRTSHPLTMTDADFLCYRVENAMAVQGIDFEDEVVLNVADDERISYAKGCYLGQEIIARIHFRGKPSRKLVVVYRNRVSAEDWERVTSKTMIAGGEEAGFFWRRG